MDGWGPAGGSNNLGYQDHCAPNTMPKAGDIRERGVWSLPPWSHNSEGKADIKQMITWINHKCVKRFEEQAQDVMKAPFGGPEGGGLTWATDYFIL